jgi:hypothetical protein
LFGTNSMANGIIQSSRTTAQMERLIPDRPLGGADDQRASRRFHDILGDGGQVIDLEDAPDLHE